MPQDGMHAQPSSPDAEVTIKRIRETPRNARLKFVNHPQACQGKWNEGCKQQRRARMSSLVDKGARCAKCYEAEREALKPATPDAAFRSVFGFARPPSPYSRNRARRAGLAASRTVKDEEPARTVQSAIRIQRREQTRLVGDAIMLALRERGSCTTGEAYQAYRTLALPTNLDHISRRRFAQYIGWLDQNGVFQVRHTNRGRYGRTRIITTIPLKTTGAGL